MNGRCALGRHVVVNINEFLICLATCASKTFVLSTYTPPGTSDGYASGSVYIYGLKGPPFG